MEFDWINIESVDDTVIKEFDCGNHAFNDFLCEKAKAWNAAGESVTYVFADEAEIKEKSVSRIYGFITINAIGLLFNNDGKNEYLSCAEIRLFAIANQLRKRHDNTISWSDTIFKIALQNLYQMSTSVIGFKAIFLNANHDGLQLYIDNGFDSISEYVIPQNDSKIELDECTPLLLMITSDTVYKIFS